MNLSSLLIIIGLVGALVSFWHRNDFPSDVDYRPQVLEEPRQTATQRLPFEVTYKDINYLVEPEFEYDLYGMIVSFRHHDGNSFMHLRSNDKLNMLDVCVIWGNNARHPLLNSIKFWNGIFTCNVSTSDQQAWDAFNLFQLSNNHLLSADKTIRDTVKNINIGDQIRVSGYLASYSTADGGKRGTSTSRLDTGDGACETVFIEHFEIVQSSGNRWRWAMYGCIAGLLIGLALHFSRPYKPYRNDRW